MIQGNIGKYNMFLVVEHPKGTFRAYRSLEYFKDNIISYEAVSWLGIAEAIDYNRDQGWFAEEQPKIRGWLKHLPTISEGDILELMAITFGSVLDEPCPEEDTFEYRTWMYAKHYVEYMGFKVEDVVRAYRERLKIGEL